MPAEKAMTFKPLGAAAAAPAGPRAREGGRRPRARRAGVSFAVAGPKLLGRATDIIFAGVLGRQLPAGITAQQAADAARAAGHGNIADLLLGSGVVPGRASTSARSRTCCCWALALYVAASVFSWLQGYLLNGVVQRTVLRLRADVEDKLQPAAAALLRRPAARRAAEPGHQRHRQRRRRRLQQTMSQLLTSLLTVVGVLVDDGR